MQRTAQCFALILPRISVLRERDVCFLVSLFWVPPFLRFVVSLFLGFLFSESLGFLVPKFQDTFNDLWQDTSILLPIFMSRFQEYLGRTSTIFENSLDESAGFCVARVAEHVQHCEFSDVLNYKALLLEIVPVFS